MLLGRKIKQKHQGTWAILTQPFQVPASWQRMLGKGGKKEKQQFQAQGAVFPSEMNQTPFARDTRGISYQPNVWKLRLIFHVLFTSGPGRETSAGLRRARLCFKPRLGSPKPTGAASQETPRRATCVTCREGWTPAKTTPWAFVWQGWWITFFLKKKKKLGFLKDLGAASRGWDNRGIPAFGIKQLTPAPKAGKQSAKPIIAW